MKGLEEAQREFRDWIEKSSFAEIKGEVEGLGILVKEADIWGVGGVAWQAGKSLDTAMIFLRKDLGLETKKRVVGICYALLHLPKSKRDRLGYAQIYALRLAKRAGITADVPPTPGLRILPLNEKSFLRLWREGIGE